MGRNNSLVYIIHMLNKIFYLCAIFCRQTITCCVWDIHHCGTCLDYSLHHPGKVFIIRSSGILCIKLHILHIALGIFHSSYSSFYNLLTIAVELIFDMRVTGSYTCMYALTLGIFQRLGSHVNILFHCSCQRTDRRPRHRLAYLNHRIEITWTRDRKTRFNHIHSQLLQLLCYLNFFNCIQLTPWHLFAIS